MLKYLIIPLSDNAVSYCHYDVPNISHSSFISTELLKRALVWSMKENAVVQFVFPSEKIPDEMDDVIQSVDHAEIVPFDLPDTQRLSQADVVIFRVWDDFGSYNFREKQTYAIRTTLSDLLSHEDDLKRALAKVYRLNLIISNVSELSESLMSKYENLLENLIPTIVTEYTRGHFVELNVLTDRITLRGMNNCDAGFESITLAPDGKFYICPAFYLDGAESVGDPEIGLDIKNPQLFRLDHAPICRNCDAYQCRRCVWLNQKMTLEVNTPSHEQCVAAHIERNASRKLLEELRKIDPTFMPETYIPEIDYLDPFDKITKKL